MKMKDILSNSWENNWHPLKPDKNFLENLKILKDCIENRIGEVLFSLNYIDSDIGVIKDPILEENILKYLKELEEYKDNFFRVWRIWEDWENYIVEVWIRCNEEEDNQDIFSYDSCKIIIDKDKINIIK